MHLFAFQINFQFFNTNLSKSG